VAAKIEQVGDWRRRRRRGNGARRGGDPTAIEVAARRSAG
jgi:hypothetical protein